jgi:methylsterol monooxygenase
VTAFSIVDNYFPGVLSSFQHRKGEPEKEGEDEKKKKVVAVGWKKEEVGLTLFNQFFVTFPVGMCLTPLFSSTIPGGTTFFTSAIQLGTMILLEDGFFYYTHRLLHTPFLFNHIHSFHHEWTEPRAINTITSHPLEHLFSNVLPLLLLPILLGVNGTTLHLWVGMATLNAVISHSGFLLGGWNDDSHDLHHKHRMGNYGVIGLFDYLHNTKIKSDGGRRSGGGT